MNKDELIAALREALIEYIDRCEACGDYACAHTGYGSEVYDWCHVHMPNKNPSLRHYEEEHRIIFELL